MAERDPRRQALIALLLVVAFLVVADGVWVGIRAVRAKDQLEQARGSVVSARAALADGDIARAVADAQQAGRDTSYASTLTHDPIWHLDSHLPLLGPSMTSVAVLAGATDQVAELALPALTSSVDDLRGGRFRAQDGAIDLAVVTHAANALVTAGSALTNARAEVAALPAHPFIGAAGAARTQLLAQLDSLLDYLSGATKAAQLAPAMLGADGPRRYFLALMNPAESRGAGGLVGTFGIVVADKGKLSLEDAGSDDDLTPFTSPVADVSPDFTARWRVFHGDTDWRDTTDSPHFPWDATALTDMWKKAKGQDLDGVIALDPAAAGSLIGAGKPLTLPSGQTITGAQFPKYVEQTIYVDFANNQLARKNALVQIERQLFADLQSSGDPTSELKALGHAAGLRELMVESNHPSEQSVLASTPIGGTMPDQPGPFVGVAIHNAIANKMDAYLQRTLVWSASACPAKGQSRTLTTTLTLTNAAPPGLPTFVAGSPLPILGVRPLGSNRSWVSVYGSVGAEGVKATLDGKTVPVRLQSERSHPVAGVYIDFAPGQSHVLQVQWLDPPAAVGADGRSIAEVPQQPFLQPLVQAANVKTSVTTCG